MATKCSEIQVVRSVEGFNSLYPELETHLKSQKGKPNVKCVCRLFLVRHGESESNIAGSVAGRTLDVELTGLGVEQSREIGHFFSLLIEHFAAIYSSPSKRAVQTAEMINQVWSSKKSMDSLIVIQDARLLEKFYGRLEGATAEEYEPYRKQHELDLNSLVSFEDKFRYKVVEDMESLSDIHARVTPLLQEAAKQYLGKNILMTSHHGLMKALFIADAAYKKHADVEYQSFHLGNASILMLESDGEDVSIRAIHGLKFK